MTRSPRPARPTPRSLARLVAVACLAASLAEPAAAQSPALRGDVVVDRDTITLADLADNAPASAAATPLFRAPALGQSGTIQTRRIVEAAGGAGVAALETGGRGQITVTRAARQVGSSEIETALKRSLEASAGLDPRTTGIVFEGAPPALLLSPDAKEDAVAADVVYDRRSRRVAGTIWIGPSPTERRASIRVTGTVIEMIEVAVTGRALARGDTVKSGDVIVERRPRDQASGDALLDLVSLDGRVVRRALAAGAPVRQGDLARPDLVTRGDIVTVVYETPGMVLTVRAKASETGALGDTVSILNPQSKKTLQAVVVGPGKVSVSAAPTGRIASAADGEGRR